ncbi:MAG: radical SAM protein [Candidatus Woesearchaeota archaeon]
MKAKMFITTQPYEIHYGDGTRVIKDPCMFEDNLGLGYLEASLEGIIECETLDSSQFWLNQDEIVESVNSELSSTRTKIVGISSFTCALEQAMSLSDAIRNALPDAIIIAGGFGPSTFPNKCLEGSVNYVALGEGDKTLPELVRCILASENPAIVKGLYFKHDDKLIFTGQREPAALDDLPFPTRKPHVRHVLNDGKYVPSFQIMGSRGCYAKCLFCDKDFVSPVYRERSVESIAEEASQIAKRFGVKKNIGLAFTDHNFLTNSNRMAELIETLGSADLVPLISGDTRISDIVRGEYVLKKYSKNFRLISTGAESFNDDFLDRWNKGHRLEHILKAMQILDETGINYGLYMIGLDKQTDDNELSKNHHIMFRSGMLKKDFYRRMWLMPTHLLTYNNDYTHSDYEKNELNFEAIGNALDYTFFRNIFNKTDKMLLKEEIKQDAEYATLVEKGSRLVEQTYVLAWVAKQAGKAGPRLRQAIMELGGKEEMKGLILRLDGMLMDLENGVNSVATRVCQAAIDKGIESKTAARIYSDMAFIQIPAERKDYRKHIEQEKKNSNLIMDYSAKAFETDQSRVYRYQLASACSFHSGHYGKELNLTAKAISGLSDEELQEMFGIHQLSLHCAWVLMNRDRERAMRIMENVIKKQTGNIIACLYAEELVDRYGRRDAMKIFGDHLKLYPTSVSGFKIKSYAAEKLGMMDVVEHCRKKIESFTGKN